MSVQHFKSLLFKSDRIQEEIEKERGQHWPNWMRLLKLQKIRLAIKDRLERIAREHSPQRLQPVRIKASRGHWQSQ